MNPVVEDTPPLSRDGLLDSPSATASRRPVNLRSIALGLAGVLFICGLTPYNDYVLVNSSLLGSYLPAGMLLFILATITLINFPLTRLAPRYAFSSAEIAVALCMALVSCSIPGVGLMGFLPAYLIGMLTLPGTNPSYELMLDQLDLPRWLFPAVTGETAQQRANDPVVTQYLSRVPFVGDSFTEHLHAVPWSAWAVPAISWGILFAMVAGMVLFLCIILRRQWVENERLPFPLATVFLSLIESSPGGGKPGGALFGSRLFLMTFAGVFVIHLMNGLHIYSPLVPQIPLSQEIGSYLADTPLRYTELISSPLRVQFIVIGVMYFVQSRMALSLWGFFLIGQMMMISYGMRGDTLSNEMRTDQQFGSLIVYGLFILWIGRQHFRMVLAQMFRGVGPGEPSEHYLSYRLAGWGMILCFAGIVAFLLVAGASLVGSLVIVALMLLFFTAMARIIAETGLAVGEIPVPMRRAWIFMLNEVPGGASLRTTGRSFFFTSLFTGLFTWDMREAMPVYGTHALKVADAGVFDGSTRQRGSALVAALGLALLVGFLAAGAGMLYAEYSHATTLDSQQLSPINSAAIYNKTAERILDPTLNYLPPNNGPIEVFSRSGHFTFGAAVTAATAVLRLRFVNWPLHPAGFLVANTGPMRLTWFSIFLGWLLKSLILRYGGPRLFASARVVFLGLIVGEAAAVAFWLVVSLSLHVAGIPYHAIQLT